MQINGINGIIGNFMGFKVIATEACCDYVQVRKHKKKRINKKWLKKYGKKLIPTKDIVLANLGRDKVIFCHPKYWDRFQHILENIK